MSEQLLDAGQLASAAQFDRQSDRYGKSHILADTRDVAMGLAGVLLPPGGTALDVATGGGHTALFLARQGWKVTAGDISRRMLENARKLCADAGFVIETRMFPAEQMPFAEGGRKQCHTDSPRQSPPSQTRPMAMEHRTPAALQGGRSLAPLG